MAKQVIHSKREFLIGISSLLLGVVLGVFVTNIKPFLGSLLLPTSDKNQLNSFQSKRVPFSFKYPNDFKIAVQPDWAVYQDRDRVEAINLGTLDAAPNAGGPATGYILVEKTEVLTDETLEQKLKQEYEQETAEMKSEMRKTGYSFSRPAPTFTKVKVGNADGVKVTLENQNGDANFAPVWETYYVERRGLRYIIGLTTMDKVEKAKFESLLSTFDFQY